MTATALRLIFALVATFVLAVAILTVAAVSGVRMIDIARGYVATEGNYAKKQKAAVLALHRYASRGDPSHFLEYQRLIHVPLEASRARAVLENEAVSRSESYRFLIRSGIHPTDVRGIAWLFRTFDKTELMAAIIEVWRRSDQKVLALDAEAGGLHRYMQSPGVTREGVLVRLDHIDRIDAELAALDEIFATRMSVASRELARLLTFGIPLLGLLLAVLAVGVSFYVASYIRRSARLLREREDRFRDVAEMSGDWIWESDADGRLSYLSDRVEAITGMPKERLLGMRRSDLADNLPGPWDEYRRIIDRHEKIDGFEFETKSADGAMRVMRISGKPIYDERGRFLGYRGTGTDVTAAVLARREADRRRELLDYSFENLGQGVVIVDADNEVVMFNRRIVEMLEIPDGVLKVGGDVIDFFRHLARQGEYGPGDPQRLADEVLTRVGSTLPYVFERSRPNGAMVEVRGQPLPSGGFVVAYRDVTEKRRALAAVERSERFTREVIDSALDAFVSVDRADRVLDWNPAAEKMFGWSRTEAIGRPFAELVLPEHLRAAHRQLLADGMKGDGGRVTGGRRETVARRRDGSEFPVEVSLSAQDSDGTTIYTAFIRDITPRKLFEMRLLAAKESAETANRAKSQFLANMSHELRTPLNAIIGFAEIMVQQMMGPLDSRYAEYAADIRQSGRHLLDLINEILDISSVESGKATLGEVSPIDLHEEVASCAHLLAHSAQGAGVAMSNEIPKDAPLLLAEPRRLRQILLNLMGNSLKFSPPGTTVTVRLDVDDEGLCLQVIDRGLGMEPEQVEKVFEPFVQLQPGSHRAQLGTGLGLTLVRNLVEMHGGRIVLQSAPGQGTTAYVRFPSARTAPRPQKPRRRDGVQA